MQEKFHVFKIAICVWDIPLSVEFLNMVLSTSFQKKNHIKHLNNPSYLLDITDVPVLFDVIKRSFFLEVCLSLNMWMSIFPFNLLPVLTLILSKKQFFVYVCIWMFTYLTWHCINTFDFSDALQLQNIISFIQWLGSLPCDNGNSLHIFKRLAFILKKIIACYSFTYQKEWIKHKYHKKNLII